MLTVRALQIVCGLCWLVPFALYWTAVLRALRCKAALSDATRTVTWFMASSQLGFVGRWILFPDAMQAMREQELVLWAGMYVLSSMCALAFVWVLAKARAQ